MRRWVRFYRQLRAHRAADIVVYAGIARGRPGSIPEARGHDEAYGPAFLSWHRPRREGHAPHGPDAVHCG